MAERLSFDAAGCTERGPRTNQEDALGHEVGPVVSVFAVADGLGGHPNGDVASQAAVDSVVGLAQLPTAEAAPALDALARNAVSAANRVVLGTGGCTTLALLVLSGTQAVVAHVGDSRVYRLRGGALEQLTEDHREERHVLNRCLGATSPDCSADSDVQVLESMPGDVWLLVTDGVGDTLEHDALREVLAELPTFGALWAAAVLVRRALDAGSRDNCTALVVRVGGAT
ncbi:PP2C family serine/threonine-protein phosphatase [Myxococcus sp. AS-1-15]|uniref:PP2C family protein-serine/threonine phosphatase n=1 Tax=Myxococcus sp. AS-1-15 TaxID=2874600 RepID=UPI001CBABDEF|nr:PP2C family serine/threonine-protein phosphatase [Myxococcus sp. AS-1-15]MBZ4395136.1 serine/threonine-protein phosphatase [Myxococcus sp. AS-1-15]